MSEDEIFKMLLIEKLDKFPLLNELFAIRDSRCKRTENTIYVNGYISLDVINNAIERVNLLNTLKEIEQSHKEENGKLRIELDDCKDFRNKFFKLHESYNRVIEKLNQEKNKINTIKK